MYNPPPPWVFKASVGYHLNPSLIQGLPQSLSSIASRSVGYHTVMHDHYCI